MTAQAVPVADDREDDAKDTERDEERRCRYHRDRFGTGTRTHDPSGRVWRPSLFGRRPREAASLGWETDARGRSRCHLRCHALARRAEIPEPTPGLEPGTPSLRVKCSTN